MTTKPKPYSNATPTRAASKAWYAGLTTAERMEADIIAGQFMTSTKAKGRVQFSPDDARELVFALACWYEGGGETHRKQHISSMALKEA